MMNQAARRAAHKVTRYGLYPKKINDWVFFEDDFLEFRKNSSDEKGWIETAVSVGTGTSAFAKADGHGGILHGVSAANENDGAQIQWVSEFVLLQAHKRMFFEAKLKISEKNPI